MKFGMKVGPSKVVDSVIKHYKLSLGTVEWQSLLIGVGSAVTRRNPEVIEQTDRAPSYRKYELFKIKARFFSRVGPRFCSFNSGFFFKSDPDAIRDVHITCTQLKYREDYQLPGIGHAYFVCSRSEHKHASHVLSLDSRLAVAPVSNSSLMSLENKCNTYQIEQGPPGTCGSYKLNATEVLGQAGSESVPYIFKIGEMTSFNRRGGTVQGFFESNTSFHFILFYFLWFLLFAS